MDTQAPLVSRASFDDESKNVNLQYFFITIGAGQTTRVPMAGDYWQYVAASGTPAKLQISIDDQDSFVPLLPGSPMYAQRRILAWVKSDVACVLALLVGDGARVDHNDAIAQGPTESLTTDPWTVSGAIVSIVILAAASNLGGLLITPGSTIRMPRAGIDTDFCQLRTNDGSLSRYLGAAMPSSPWLCPQQLLVPPGAALELRYVGSIAYDIGYVRL